MTGFSRGDVVLVNFVFSDQSAVKRRPALILTTDRYHENRQEAIVAAITSNISRLLMGDYRIKDWRRGGLLYPSVVTGIIRTVKQDMLHRKLGAISAGDQRAIEQKLRSILGL